MQIMQYVKRFTKICVQAAKQKNHRLQVVFTLLEACQAHLSVFHFYKAADNISNFKNNIVWYPLDKISVSLPQI